ncbi:hypothetical protein OG264_38425 [Streptomyces xanthophaeus]|uniref:hypothetical protein n=1 Tax=Streptomyces xanthophaeus TaxID=67385 RepID=UPI00386BFF78|nr:hypothetical protein OG264_00010 [Streptomyces xanthophaeus]WST26867.1 hypothetical protein OG264_38425 [Streptomyces xanthophaeus]WST58161.1 hypothetical protein OG605_00010 [Streptomyces xanthophaeus]WST64989.1 hypothetical protein OG605_38350 [Streptomyces xanthophaeus]
MSTTERTDIAVAEEPPGPGPAPRAARWSDKARRIRNEAGIHLVRGAAAAIGGTLVIYASTWLSLR